MRRAFELEPLGRRELKGLAQPLGLFRVVREVEHPLSRHLAPLIGRDRETERLRACWAEARSGRGQVVLLGGEAGIGKSRLVEYVSDEADAEPEPPLR